jgi:hypothetical protein
MTITETLIIVALVLAIIVKAGFWAHSRFSTVGILGRLAGVAETNVVEQGSMVSADVVTLMRHLLAKLDANAAEAKQAAAIQAALDRLKAPIEAPKP